jgi:glutamyl-tRNA synthetase
MSEGSNRIGNRNGPVTINAPGEVGAKAKVKAQPKVGVLQPELRGITKAEIARLGGGQVKERPVRVRFAPSPTGHLHIGGARTALMNFLFAKKMGGEFVLRIEDTDQMRSKPEFTEGILESLKMLGMNWDGQPIFQSQRSDLYNGAIDRLIKEGKAYADPQGSGAIFFKMPPEATIYVPDRIKGNVPINVANADGVSDYVIRRSDGSPTFLFANVFDDGDQGITHILRGDDHLGNAARQIPLFRALGFEVPEFYHMPLIHGDPEVLKPAYKDEQGVEHKAVYKPGGKLSKRHGAVWVGEYINLGYSPNVLMNHFARMGMHYETDQTQSIEDLARQFDPLNMSKSRSVLGVEALNRRMMFAIKKTDNQELVAELQRRIGDPELLKAHLEDPGTEKRDGFFARTGITAAEAKKLLEGVTPAMLEAVADGAKARTANYGEIVDLLVLLRAEPNYQAEEKAVYAGAPMKKLMNKLKGELEALPANKWTLKTLDKTLQDFNDGNNAKYTQYGQSLRWMLTGMTTGVPLHNTLALLGREESLRRLGEILG